VLLTFDDGPDLQGTPLIMDELDRRRLKAVFFVMGQHIVRNRPEDLARRDLLRKLAVHGHHVGNHTMNHKDLCRNPGALAEEVDHAAEIITYATGVRPLLFRSPYGAAAGRWIARWQSATSPKSAGMPIRGNGVATARRRSSPMSPTCWPTPARP